MGYKSKPGVRRLSSVFINISEQVRHDFRWSWSQSWSIALNSWSGKKALGFYCFWFCLSASVTWISGSWWRLNTGNCSFCLDGFGDRGLRRLTSAPQTPEVYCTLLRVTCSALPPDAKHKTQPLRFLPWLICLTSLDVSVCLNICFPPKMK